MTGVLPVLYFDRDCDFLTAHSDRLQGQLPLRKFVKVHGNALALLVGLMMLDGAFANAADSSGLSLGLRSGYGVPMGSATQGEDLLQRRTKGMVPIWVDLGYRLSSNFYLGGFVQYGIGFAPNTCGSDLRCSINDLRFGINAHFHFLPAAFFDPWVGLGVGYEILNQSISGNIVGTPVNASTNPSGFEFVNVQLGGDFKIASNFYLGPFMAFTVGQFSRGSVSAGGSGSVALDLTNKAIHDWLIAGVRGVVDFGL
jgi:hypothetical protein